MAAVPLALVAAGTIFKAIGDIHQGQADAAAADYNAQIADQNANLVRQQSAAEEQQQRILARKQIGQTRASYGASGVSLEGSPEDVLGESAANAELDALTIRHSGTVKALAYQNEASLERFKAGQARTGGYLGAAGSLLMGGGQAAYFGSTGGKDKITTTRTA